MIDELKNIGEQPENLSVQAVATGDDKGTEKSSEGSPLGKFKDSETLLNAYNELQSEFTRKCQKLSDAEKKLQEIVADQVSGDEISKVSDEFAWNQNIGEFLQSHKNAGDLVEDITNEIINDVSLRDSEDGLEKAYARVIEKKYIPHGELAKDKDFLENVFKSNLDEE